MLFQRRVFHKAASVLPSRRQWLASRVADVRVDQLLKGIDVASGIADQGIFGRGRDGLVRGLAFEERVAFVEPFQVSILDHVVLR